MRVLTFGWDYPPLKNGGLGVACFGLTRELTRDGVEVTFVLPRTQPVVPNTRFVFADAAKKVVRAVTPESYVGPYRGSDTIVETYTVDGTEKIYSRTLLQEVYRFAAKAEAIAAEEDFDIIHAHDWTSYLAGMAAKRVSGKPLVLHVHATSFDQAGGDNVDPEIYKIERAAFAAADKVLTVSDFTRRLILEKHGAPKDRVEVVHNGCETMEVKPLPPSLSELKAAGKKIVLYHGRITIQKGIDHLVRAAVKVVQHNPDVVFVISGWGDMKEQIMHQVGALGLSKHFIFAGSLWDEERDRMYQSADLVVMPSVSEPFGLVPLEAIQHGAPSLISKQSGVGEVTSHVLKVDFWDVDEMANKILATLRYPVMHKQLVEEGKREVERLTWSEAAKKVKEVYGRLVHYLAA